MSRGYVQFCGVGGNAGAVSCGDLFFLLPYDVIDQIIVVGPGDSVLFGRGRIIYSG